MKNLRTQKNGKQKRWKTDEIETGLKHFFNEHSRYPTSTEIDKYKYLPSAKSIQRSFGGLVKIREELGLEGNSDLRTGEHSSNRCFTINERNNVVEKKVYDFLVNRYGKPFVHREYLFTDDRRIRADFFVYDSKSGFCVDVFYPADRRNLIGCLNSKLKKYSHEYMSDYPIIFLQMNEELDQKILDDVMKNKKNKLLKEQSLMCWDTFTRFCMNRKQLKSLKSFI